MKHLWVVKLLIAWAKNTMAAMCRYLGVNIANVPYLSFQKWVRQN